MAFALATGIDAGLASLDPEADVVRALRTCAAASDAADMRHLAAVARLEITHRIDDPEAQVAADRFFEHAPMRDRTYGARYVLPGRFHVTGDADAP